eukprot:1795456-Prymnesium_polylepis.1
MAAAATAQASKPPSPQVGRRPASGAGSPAAVRGGGDAGGSPSAKRDGGDGERQQRQSRSQYQQARMRHR